MPDDSPKYSETQLRQVIEREQQDARISVLERQFMEMMQRQEKWGAELKASFDHLATDIEKSHANIRETRDEVRSEMRDGFMTKTDGELLETRLESKIDSVMGRVDAAVGSVRGTLRGAVMILAVLQGAGMLWMQWDGNNYRSTQPSVTVHIDKSLIERLNSNEADRETGAQKPRSGH